MKAFAAALIACAAATAQAQGTVTLVCSSSHDGPPQFQIEINFDRSTVSYPAHSAARIEADRITWERPRQEGGGAVRVAARYNLNRMTGMLSGENLCLPRDSSWCNPGGSVSYCKRGTRQF
ncbi:MAG: hypothetical protein ACT4P3_15270 [Betaproteobacteria bacterium]